MLSNLPHWTVRSVARWGFERTALSDQIGGLASAKLRAPFGDVQGNALVEISDGRPRLRVHRRELMPVLGQWIRLSNLRQKDRGCRAR